MKTKSHTELMLGLIIVLLLFIASKPSQDTFDKITVREFELVDQHGIKRVTIEAYPEGEVVFRLKDAKGNIRVKLAASFNLDRKSTRLNSSHLVISYAVFCLKKKRYSYNLSMYVRRH